ncbi:MAG: IS66 family insertion sequence element accessory protein TnpB [Culicoidibacterales bacterium]
MLVNFSNAKHIFIVCGHTDMRRGIDGLANIITEQYNLDLFQEDAIFLFCGRRRDRYKVLHWDRDGFALLYKRIEDGNLQWPRDQDEVRQLSAQQLRWLLEGLSVQQPRAIKKPRIGAIT